MNGINLYHKHVGAAPNPLVTSVVETVSCGRGAALDLGAGSLRDSKFLKESGFARVVAVDSSEESLAYAVEGIELVIAPIQNYRPDRNAFDLIISCNTLFFVKKRSVEQLLQAMHKALRPGGIMAFNVLGMNDPWARNPSNSAFTLKEVQALTHRFKIESLGEVRQMMPTASGGQKFWHQWVLVLRRP